MGTRVGVSARPAAGMLAEDASLPALFEQSSHEPKGTGAGAPGTELLELRPANAEGRAGGAQHLGGSLSEHRVSGGNTSVGYFLSLGTCLHQGWCTDRPEGVADPTLIQFGVEQGVGIKGMNPWSLLEIPGQLDKKAFICPGDTRDIVLLESYVAGSRPGDGVSQVAWVVALS